jgi:ribosomal protein S18 acetylase RimI-like enzyme
MRVSLRPATPADITACGRICYEAFTTIARAHCFPMDWGCEEMAIKVVASRLAHRQTYGVVAEAKGQIVGSAFLKEHHPIGAIGPITVAPAMQGAQVGRLMMEHLLERAREAGLAGMRLVQAAYNPHSLALYTKLGFQVREFLVCLHGKPLARATRGIPVRAGTEDDLVRCNWLCERLHGYARAEDLLEASEMDSLSVVEQGQRITGYSTGINFRGHTIAETDQDAQALIAAAENLPEPGLLVPARNGDLLRWALDNGLRITQPLSLMTLGRYQPPTGVFLPSIHA